MIGALVIAAVFESAGALIAGGDVVGTISKGIIDPAAVADPARFIWVMMAALLAAALWVNLATMLGAPVSTTHAIVGGVHGRGHRGRRRRRRQLADHGRDRGQLGHLAAARRRHRGSLPRLHQDVIIYQDDKIAAARRWVPVLMAVMAGAFAAYLALKGLKQLIDDRACMARSLIGVGLRRC